MKRIEFLDEEKTLVKKYCINTTSLVKEVGFALLLYVQHGIPTRIPIDYDVSELSVTFVALSGPTLGELTEGNHYKAQVDELVEFLKSLGLHYNDVNMDNFVKDIVTGRIGILDLESIKYVPKTF